MQDFLIDPLLNLKSYKGMLEDLEEGTSPIATYGLIDENLNHIIYGLKEHTGRPILIITHDENKSRKIYEDLKSLGEDRVQLFPKKEILFYDIHLTSSEIANQRLKIMSQIVAGEDIILVASLESILDKIISKSVYKKHIRKIKLGEEIHLNKLVNELIESGYERVDMVQALGEFSLRGGIIDIFSPMNDNPYRMELFGEEIDSIRSFDFSTQRSIENLEEINISPVNEILIEKDSRKYIIEKLEFELKRFSRGEKETKFYKLLDDLKEKAYISNMDLVSPFIEDKNLNSILEYFPSNGIILIDEPGRIKEEDIRLREDLNLRLVDLLESNEVLPIHGNINYRYEDLVEKIKKYQIITSSGLLKSENEFPPKAIYNFAVKSVINYHGKMDILIEDLNHYKYRGYKIVILTGSEKRAERLQGILLENALESLFYKDRDKEIKSNQIFISLGSLENGFEYPQLKFIAISDKQIFGSQKKKRRSKAKQKGEKITDFADLEIGSYVVHENHGIGRYEGIEQLDIQGAKKDYFNIRYKDNDKLYIPIDQMNLIQKYVGSDSHRPRISKLNSGEWQRSKTRAKKAVEDMAVDLLELYAKRENVKGYSFGEDGIWQRQFEDLFPYEETEGQVQSSIEIKKNMEDIKPMDRLLCGDVGYGKTEVALRAAFKALMDGKQVAILVPTTILAQQHYNTMMERFSNFPINAALLNRFRTKKEQDLTIEGLKNGTVDIVVGTHRLLSKDVKFKDLGLLIIDEEQRFGVKHKEKLKGLKTNIDVLTLTATPIPRTLHMSLVGIRDMSVIEEPPEERYPIQTYVVEYNEQMIRDAIIKEISRGGQIYFVYNRVATIERMTNKLRKLVPEAKFTIGHGQMPERELERTMMDFLNKEYDVLVCTTIIETGLDIPNVNTIIIHDADKMGLSQLYQLRGRAGRSNRIAYGYFTYGKNKVLSEVSEKRLRAIKEFTEFGSGFKIAMRDLEIRGAGNLLGLEQHGHIEAIGYDLYVKFLADAIKRLKGEKVVEDIETSIDIRVNGFIPLDYIDDEEQKIEVYKKIAAIEDFSSYMDLIDELIDRFGDIPPATENLMYISYIKALANKNKFINIIQIEDRIRLDLFSTEYLSLELIDYLSREYKSRINFDLSSKPHLDFKAKKEVLGELKSLLEKIDGFNNRENDI